MHKLGLCVWMQQGILAWRECVFISAGGADIGLHPHATSFTLYFQRVKIVSRWNSLMAK